MDTATCPTCGHAATHSDLLGCLQLTDGVATCDCTADWTPPKTLDHAHAERDAAMAKAESGTDPNWQAEATATVLHLAKTGEDFTPDDVWDRMESLAIPAPREPRALGPIIKRMTSSGLIRAKGFTESRRRHGAPVRLYEAGPDL